MDAFLYDEFYRIERTHWWSVGMRGVFRMLLTDALRGVTTPSLLDIGCGTGIALEELGGYARVYGVDLVWAALAYSRERDRTVPLVQADVTRLPIAAGRMDAVLAFDVIEHLEDDVAALREIRRALRPGGVALVNVPAFPSLWSAKDTANHHRRRYRRADLERALAAAGFQVERITYTNALLFPPIWCARQLQRFSRKEWNSDAEYHPATWVNRTLLGLLRLERGMLRVVDLPVGTSVTCVARRPA